MTAAAERTEGPTFTIFTQAELDCLATQPIGRLATVSPDGQVQNNPTDFFVDRRRTPEGWEPQFATNHPGHFAPTLGLHKALTGAGGAHVVSVSSGSIRTGLHRHIVMTPEIQAVFDSADWETAEQGAATCSPLIGGISGRCFENCNQAEVTDDPDKGVALHTLNENDAAPTNQRPAARFCHLPVAPRGGRPGGAAPRRPAVARRGAGQSAELADEGLTGHHRLHAVRAHLLETAGDHEAARSSYWTAARLATSLPNSTACRPVPSLGSEQGEGGAQADRGEEEAGRESRLETLGQRCGPGCIRRAGDNHERPPCPARL